MNGMNSFELYRLPIQPKPFVQKDLLNKYPTIKKKYMNLFFQAIYSIREEFDARFDGTFIKPIDYLAQILKGVISIIHLIT